MNRDQIKAEMTADLDQLCAETIRTIKSCEDGHFATIGDAVDAVLAADIFRRYAEVYQARQAEFRGHLLSLVCARLCDGPHFSAAQCLAGELSGGEG